MTELIVRIADENAVEIENIKRRYDCVELVRCRNCEFYRDDGDKFGYCKYNNHTTVRDWFCADGRNEDD